MRIGSRYEVVAAYNPLAIFPARIYPIYRTPDSFNNNQVFMQDCDSDGIVRDYRAFEVSQGDIVQPYFGEKINNWIDQSAIYGYAMRANEMNWVKGLDQFCRFLRHLLEPGERARLARTPFIALELARFLKEDSYEAVFAGLAARHLAAISLESATNWLSRAALSEVARARGTRVLDRPVVKSFRSSLTFPTVRIGYMTPAFANHVRDHKFDPRFVKKIKNLASYFEVHNLRHGDIVFLNWKEFSDVSANKILEAGEMGVNFGISFENDINPKHRILQNLAPCRIIKSVDGAYLAALVKKVVGV